MVTVAGGVMRTGVFTCRLQKDFPARFLRLILNTKVLSYNNFRARNEKISELL